jgi:protein-S-isoprenylcysteine O-methyltransferase Ste14
LRREKQNSMSIEQVALVDAGATPAPRTNFAQAPPQVPRAPPPALTRKAFGLDLCERAFVAALFGNFAWRMLTSSAMEDMQINIMLLLLGELLPIVFVLVRAPSATLSQRSSDWAFGIMGTTAGLLITPAEAAPLLPAGLCFGIMIAGLSLQVSAKAVLGLSFGVVAANRGVKMFGPYRLVRHPIYAGYTITHVGNLLAMPSLSNAGFYTLALALQIVRTYCEERVLKDDAAYRAYATRVRYRLLPGIF